LRQLHVVQCARHGRTSRRAACRACSWRPVEFVDGAIAQARSLGADPAAVYVEHPIQDRTDAEMTAIADRAVDEILANLVRDDG
jgi:hypothetical protein